MSDDEILEYFRVPEPQHTDGEPLTLQESLRFTRIMIKEGWW